MKKLRKKLKPLEIVYFSQGKVVGKVKIPDPRIKAVEAINNMGKTLGIIAVPS